MRTDGILLGNSPEVDLGNARPIVLDADVKGLPDHRRVSMRWLTGTVLAAMTSTYMMGIALYTSMEGRRHVPIPASTLGHLPQPEAAQAARHDVVAKGDILTPSSTKATGPQIIKVSMISHEGEKDVVRIRPLARVTAKLQTTFTIPEDQIPKFNPLRIFADANRPPEGTTTDSIYGAAGKGDYTLKVRDFTIEPTDVADVPGDVAHAERLVRENAPFLGATKGELATATGPFDQQRFALGFAENDAFDRLGVQLTTENISTIAKSTAAAKPSNAEERVVAGQEGSGLIEILIANEATDEEAQKIADALKKSFNVTALTTDDRLRIRLSPATDSDIENRYRPDRVAMFRDGEHVGTVALNDQGAYVPVSEDRPNIDMNDTTETDSKRPRLYESLYETALINKVPSQVIDDLVRIYALDVDFSARVGDQDSVEFIYTDPTDRLNEAPDIKAPPQQVMFAAITTAGRTHRFYRYMTPDDNTLDYYDINGSSARKFLMRKPVTNATFRSGFGMRLHPLLGEPKMHTGVDWAAPRGTPIIAAGDGVVGKEDWVNGYGRYIRVDHTNGYSTAYGHMSGYAPGISEGTRVRQGQVIGYVGTTGYATGPHVHFEILVNNRQMDPMRIKLPQGRTLQGDVLQAFNSERAHIDTLTATRGNTTASN